VIGHHVVARLVLPLCASGQWQEHGGERGPDADTARSVVLGCVRSPFDLRRDRLDRWNQMVHV
jgi:hypothetical protein